MGNITWQIVIKFWSWTNSKPNGYRNYRIDCCKLKSTKARTIAKISSFESCLTKINHMHPCRLGIVHITPSHWKLDPDPSFSRVDRSYPIISTFFFVCSRIKGLFFFFSPSTEDLLSTNSFVETVLRGTSLHFTIDTFKTLGMTYFASKCH